MERGEKTQGEHMVDVGHASLMEQFKACAPSVPRSGMYDVFQINGDGRMQRIFPLPEQ